MKIAKNQIDILRVATAMKEETDWGKYPKLAAIFETRPPQNIYWEELVKWYLERIDISFE